MCDRMFERRADSCIRTKAENQRREIIELEQKIAKSLRFGCDAGLRATFNPGQRSMYDIGSALPSA